MDMVISSPPLLESLKILSQNSAWDANPRDCYGEYSTNLCSVSLAENFKASSSCFDSLNLFFKIIASCAQPTSHCPSFESGRIEDPELFCRNSYIKETTKEGDLVEVSLQGTVPEDCVSLAHNYNVCRKIGVDLLRLEESFCESSAWTGYCKADVLIPNDEATDEMCREVVIPGVLYSAVQNPETLHLIYRDQYDDFCRHLRAEYVARLTRKHADGIIKSKAGYDILQSCNNLLSFMEEEYWRTMQSIEATAKTTLQPLKDAWLAMIDLRSEVKALLDGKGADSSLNKERIYILAEDATLYDNLRRDTEKVVSWYKEKFKTVDPSRDDWGRPVLADLDARMTRMQATDVTSEAAATQLTQIRQRALQEWSTYPKPILQPTETTQTPAWNWGDQSTAFPSTHLADALQNKAVAAGYSLLGNLQTADEAVKNSVIVLDYKIRYCKGDEVTLKTAMAFAVVTKLTAVQLQLI